MSIVTIIDSDGNNVAINSSKILCIREHKDNRSIDVGGVRPIYTHVSFEELLSLFKNE